MNLAIVSSRGVTGRADLLRLLAVVPRGNLVLDQDASGWFGYVRRATGRQIESSVRLQAAVSLQARAEVTRERKAPLQLPFLHVLVRRETRPQLDPQDPALRDWENATEITEEDARSLSDRRLIEFEDLVPQARLMPALRRLLGADRAGPIDLDRLTRQVAACRIPRHLPRCSSPRWHPDLVVVLDFSTRLWPYRWDMHQLAKRLLRLVGRTGVSLRIVERGPLGPWSDWVAHQNRTSPVEPPEHGWAMPRPKTPVLLVSDLGMLLGPGSATAATWAAFVDDLMRAQICPLALVPLGAAQLGAPVPSRLPILRWSPDARPHAVPVRGEAGGEPEGLDDLLAMIATTRRVDPPLLRALRRLNLKASQNAGLEGAAWCHADVEAIHTASIRTEVLEPNLRRFRALPPALQAKTDQLRSTHHRHLRALINHEEQLWWESHAQEAAVALSPGASERGAEARAFFRQMATAVASADPDTAARWRSVAEGVVWRADAAMAERCSDALYPIMASLERTKGEEGPLPEWVDPQKLAAAMGSDRPGKPHWLVRDAASARLVLQAQPPGARQSVLVDDLGIDDGGVRITIESSDSRQVVSGTVLPALDPRDTVAIETSSERLLVAPVERPLGALNWGCDREGIFVQSPPFGRWNMRWSGDALRASPHPGVDAEGRWMLEANTDEQWSSLAERPPRVFMSRGLTPLEHEQHVLALVRRLRADGIDAETEDSYPPAVRPPSHLAASLAAADFVLVEPKQDLAWQEAILRQVTRDPGEVSQKLVPVLFSDTSPEQIPAPLKGGAYYAGDTTRGYDALLRRLTEQHGTARSGKGTVRFGIDAPYGVYAELLIASEHGPATQRLRWIPPGTFLMGSPQDEPGRSEDEGPRHEVTITNGFWLFDTPCTQALWQAVMGENPSYFQSPDRPVERVSWDDVQRFLERINALVPGLDLVLPTEAQWEYACRAGTQTAIYTGDIEILGTCNAPALDPIAWYGGNSGVYFDLFKGRDASRLPEKQYVHSRAGTRLIRMKQANRLGLYDMLGNVLEWCADGRRDYTKKPATDPTGSIRTGGSRALRGGSWYGFTRVVRSAARYWSDSSRAATTLASAVLVFKMAVSRVKRRRPGQRGLTISTSGCFHGCVRLETPKAVAAKTHEPDCTDTVIG
jgi:formylglycine-generating enzyme required for sulfatase activity